MKLSVELTYAIMNDDARLDEVASQGVAAVSVPIDFIESSRKQTLKERAAALKSRGIEANTAHPRFGMYNTEHSLVNQYSAPRGLYLERLKDCFERIAIAGAKTAPLHTGGACLPEAPEWALDLCAESIGAVLPEAAAAGITLTIENTFFVAPQHWDGGSGISGRPPESAVTVYDDMGKICKLIDGFASPFVAGCFDVGHAHYLGDVASDFAKMGERIKLYHIHDNNTARDMHLPPGYGTLDWELFGGLIRSDKSDYYAYIEADPWTPGQYGHMIRETNALLNGGRRGSNKRCLKCGHLILVDNEGEFCACV